MNMQKSLTIRSNRSLRSLGSAKKPPLSLVRLLKICSYSLLVMQLREQTSSSVKRIVVPHINEMNLRHIWRLLSFSRDRPCTICKAATKSILNGSLGGVRSWEIQQLSSFECTEISP